MRWVRGTGRGENLGGATKSVEPKAREVCDSYLDGLGRAIAEELTIRRRVSRLNYSRRCAEASAVQAHILQGISLSLLECR